MTSERRNGVVALVVMSCIGASMGIFARLLERDMALFQQVLFRILAGFLIGYVIFHRSLDLKKLRALPRWEWGLLVLRASVLYLMGISLGTKAYVSAKYSNVAFIMALPVTAVFGILIFREKATATKVLLLLLSFVGAMLIAVKDYSSLMDRQAGELYALLAVTLFSFGIVARKWHSSLLNDREITQLVLLIGASELLVASLISGESMAAIRWSSTTVIVVLAAGTFNVLYMVLANYGFHRVDAVLGNNIIATQPLFGLVLGLALYHDVPLPIELLGGGLICAALVLMIRGTAPRARSRTGH